MLYFIVLYYFNEYYVYIDCIILHRYEMLHIYNLNDKPTRKVGCGVELTIKRKDKRENMTVT